MIDIRTSSLAAGFAALVLCVPLLPLVKNQKAFPGVFQWALGLLSACLGLALIGLRGRIPDILSVGLGNMLALAFSVFVVRGMQAFLGKPRRSLLDAGTLLVTAAGILVFLGPMPDMRVRIALFSLFSAFMQVRSFRVVWLEFPRVMPRRDWVLLGTFAAYGAWHFVRAVLAILIERPSADFASTGLYQGVTFLVGMGMLIVTSTSLVAAMTRRFEKDLSGAKQEVQTLSGLLPICSICKRIHDEVGSWTPVEKYVSTRSEALFSHGLCPDCMEEHYPETAP